MRKEEAFSTLLPLLHEHMKRSLRSVLENREGYTTSELAFYQLGFLDGMTYSGEFPKQREALATVIENKNERVIMDLLAASIYDKIPLPQPEFRLDVGKLLERNKVEKTAPIRPTLLEGKVVWDVWKEGGLSDGLE